MTVSTSSRSAASAAPDRSVRMKRFLMCRPTFFDVTYAINPWMDPNKPVDTALAITQWEQLKAAYEGLGHTVDVIEQSDGLPDMVYAANGGIVLDGRAMAARFTFAERQPEGELYRSWLADAGFAPAEQAVEQNEGEGDFLVVGDLFLAGTGFRTSPAAHLEVQRFFDRPVVSLELVDPRFYHLDTALTVLDDSNVAYYPGAFSQASNILLRRLFPAAIIATDADAEVLGLNAISDGVNVIFTDKAVGLHQQYRDHGYNPIGIDLSELLKGGGSIKCCTLELRS